MDVLRPSLTLAEFGESWFAELTPRQQKIYAAPLRHQVGRVLGKRPISSLVAADINELFSRLLRAGYSGATADFAQGVLAQLWRAAHGRGLLSMPWPLERKRHDLPLEHDAEEDPEPQQALRRSGQRAPRGVSRISVVDYAEQWLQSPRCRPPWIAVKTAKVRAGFVRTYVMRAPFGHKPVCRVTKSDVAAFQRSLFASGLSYKTVCTIIRSILGPMFRDAVEDGLLVESPARGLRWPREKLLRPDPFSPKESQKILSWYERNEPHFLLFVALVFLAGMRPSEAAGLRRKDIDPKTGRVSIEQAMTGGVAGPPKTRQSTREIFVGARVRKLLADRTIQRLRSDDYLCTTPTGKPIDTDEFGSKHFRRCLRSLGIYQRGKSIYRGRHSFISLAATKRAPLPAIAGFTGTSVAKIERHYMRWFDELRDPLEGSTRRAQATARSPRKLKVRGSRGRRGGKR